LAFPNPVFVGMGIMVLLSLLRAHVAIALLAGTAAAGLAGSMAPWKIIVRFGAGLSSGASIAINYALLGAFACALARSGLAEWALRHILKNLGEEMDRRCATRCRLKILFALGALALLCKSLVPVHIAFIPIMVPPLLEPMGRLRIDRRAVACILVFGLVISYVAIPIGFGTIFLKNILIQNLSACGLSISLWTALKAVTIPSACAAIGLAVALTVSYGRPRTYAHVAAGAIPRRRPCAEPLRRKLIPALASMPIVLAVQLLSGNNLAAGMLAGLLFLLASGALGPTEIGSAMVEGVRSMASIAAVMVIAGGFAAVLRDSGGIESLTGAMGSALCGNGPLAAAIMLCTGTAIAFTIGSSFATIPIVSAVYVPLCASLGFSQAATAAIVACSAIPGDPASPLSNTTLGATSGLAADGHFEHMADCVLPSALHCALPLLVGGWIAAMVL
jgi:predicted histidine transporter YuiF (NhaC family)